MPRTWVAKLLGVMIVTALVVAFMPIEQVFAAETAPETKSAELEALAVEASETLESQTDTTDGRSEGGTRLLRERSEVMEAPIPFSGLGFIGSGPDAPAVHWRVLDGDGVWTDWHLVEPLDVFDGPDPGSAEHREATDRTARWVSDAIWVGAATHIQIQVQGGALEDLDVTVIDTAGLSESLMAKAKRTLFSLGTAGPAEAADGRPRIRSRAEWGADESCTSGEIRYATPKAAVLHHTVTKNDYTEDEVPQQIRNMYHWHTACHGSGNGWNDLGYNFVIDRFGRIWEGRRGGIDKGVIGAHAGGWNTGTFGVALMGNHNTLVPSQVSLDAAAELISWKFNLHDIDVSASATTRLNDQTIPTLVGHRNVRGSYTANPDTTTDCPGELLYTRMGELRADVEAGGSTWFPVVGDWNGDGRTTIGWFNNGRWTLRNANSSGSAHLSFTYGRYGDLPVVGDWNGDGRTTVGIVRDGRWHLRNANSSGSAHHTFWYGRGAIDYPMAGDWNGNGRDTPAIVRDGEWHLRNSLSGGAGDIVFVYGRVTQGDIPVVGDWTGGGRDLPGILRDGTWHLRYAQSGGYSDRQFIYGRVTQGDFPIVGDWNRDGKTSVGVVREDVWHLRNSLSGGPADLSFSFR